MPKPSGRLMDKKVVVEKPKNSFGILASSFDDTDDEAESDVVQKENGAAEENVPTLSSVVEAQVYFYVSNINNWCDSY